MTPPEDDLDFGELLKVLRNRAGWNQKYVADHIGIKRQAYGEVERGGGPKLLEEQLNTLVTLHGLTDEKAAELQRAWEGDLVRRVREQRGKQRRTARRSGVIASEQPELIPETQLPEDAIVARAVEASDIAGPTVPTGNKSAAAYEPMPENRDETAQRMVAESAIQRGPVPGVAGVIEATGTETMSRPGEEGHGDALPADQTPDVSSATSEPLEWDSWLDEMRPANKEQPTELPAAIYSAEDERRVGLGNDIYDATPEPANLETSPADYVPMTANNSDEVAFDELAEWCRFTDELRALNALPSFAASASTEGQASDGPPPDIPTSIPDDRSKAAWPRGEKEQLRKELSASFLLEDPWDMDRPSPRASHIEITGEALVVSTSLFHEPAASGLPFPQDEKIEEALRHLEEHPSPGQRPSHRSLGAWPIRDRGNPYRQMEWRIERTLRLHGWKKRPWTALHERQIETAAMKGHDTSSSQQGQEQSIPTDALEDMEPLPIRATNAEPIAQPPSPVTLPTYPPTVWVTEGPTWRPSGRGEDRRQGWRETTSCDVTHGLSDE